MKYCDLTRPARLLRQREPLKIDELHSLWRLDSGALRIDTTVGDNTCSFVRLVLPGDVLGLENLVGVTDPLVARALTYSRLIPVTLYDDAQFKQLLIEAVSQGYQRARELITLRTGTTDDRVKRLLITLARNNSDTLDETTACAMPSLSDMATIVNAAPETVCRSLASLRQTKFLQDCSPEASKYKHLAQRQHRLQSMPASAVAA
jgi:CRP-like cAMP-binding protein